MWQISFSIKKKTYSLTLLFSVGSKDSKVLLSTSPISSSDTLRRNRAVENTIAVLQKKNTHKTTSDESRKVDVSEQKQSSAAIF